MAAKKVLDPRPTSRGFIFYDVGLHVDLWFTNPDATEFMKQHSKAISYVNNVRELEWGGAQGDLRCVTGELQLKVPTRTWSWQVGRCIAYNVAAIVANLPTHRCRRKVAIAKMRRLRGDTVTVPVSPNLQEPRSSEANLKLDTVSRSLLPAHIAIQGELLGRGSFGTVTAGTDTCNQRRVAIKLFQQGRGLQEAIDEAAVLLKLQSNHCLHNNHIVKLIGFYLCGEMRQAALVMERADMSLEELLTPPSGERWNQPEAGRLFSKHNLHEVNAVVQLLNGVSYMHSQHIVHRDLKPANMLMVAARDTHGVMSLQLMVCDFGWAGSTSEAAAEDPHTLCQSPIYRAPEVWYGWCACGCASDNWSLALICSEICSWRLCYGTQGVFRPGNSPRQGNNLPNLTDNFLAKPILSPAPFRPVAEEDYHAAVLRRMVALCKASYVHSLTKLPRPGRNTMIAPHVLASEPPRWPVISFSVQLCADAPGTKRAEKLTTLLKKFFTWEVRSRLTSTAAFRQMLEMINDG